MRIRTETLRANLLQSRQTLECLLSSSHNLEEMKAKLPAALKRADSAAEVAGSAAQVAGKAFRAEGSKIMSDMIDFLSTTTDFLNHHVVELGNWQKALKNSEETSFIAKVNSFIIDHRKILRVEWPKALTELPNQLIREIDAKPPTWDDLTRWERQAKDEVFGASVELLGGIALRNARLNADICELAEHLLQEIRPGSNHWALLGGVSNILLRLDQVIRLPVPQWTIWDLPFAFHELWYVDRETRERTHRHLRKVSTANAMQHADIEHRLADAFATYAVGPAFSYAAITMSFDPGDAAYDRRVQAICAMLREMGSPNTGPGSYRLLASEVERSWQEAAGAARRETPSAAVTSHEDYAVLRAALLEQLPDDAHRQELQRAWDVAIAGLRARPAATATGPDDFDRLCKPMADELRSLGFQAFPESEWSEVLKDSGKVFEPGSTHKLSHVLNASWAARVSAPPPDFKLLDDRLTNRAKTFLEQKSARVAPAGAPPASPA